MENQTPTYHNPVLLPESIEGLNIKKEGIYIDTTFGGGGHAKVILEALGEDGQLLGFDQDEDANENILEDSRFRLLPFNFRFLKQSLRLERLKKVDGILADLGVSSHQFDTADRGFSFRFDAALDMRMNQSASLTAKEILNTYTADKLQTILGMYGEVRNARTLAKAIVKARQLKKIERISELLAIAEPLMKGKQNRYLSQVFQALRMEVNDEIGALKDLLIQATDILNPGGRLVVITYHSLEDRLVKNWIKNGTFENEPERDAFGNFYKPLQAINRKVIVASEQEIKENPRARSAKLRIAEKVDLSE
jgi:16S rRNA (cytosine1402-N4)-methyltransferase